MNLSQSHLRLRLDLSLRYLLLEWRGLLAWKWLYEDLWAGWAVATASLPLSLSIALASGVEPRVGLYSAMAAGLVCSLFGRSPWVVSGPAAAMAVLIGSVAQTYGLGGLALVGFFCGVLQLLTGVLGLGQVFRWVPMPVVAGFSAGIGAILLMGQLPRALGLPAPDEAHVWDGMIHLSAFIHEARFSALALALGALGISLFLPKFFQKIPAPLIALGVPTWIAVILKIQGDTVGSFINTGISSGIIYRIDSGAGSGLWRFCGSLFLVYLLASMETLVAAAAVDRLTKAQSHDPDQELMAQGLGNMASACFGGIPVTAVIARSALNIRAGAKTRRSVLFSVMFLMMALLTGPWMNRIPLSVLSGVLFSVVLRMMHPREFLQFWRSSRGEGLIYLVTFFAVVSVDLTAGVEAGAVAVVILAGFRWVRSRTKIRVFDSAGPTTILVEGSLTFLSSPKIASVRSSIAQSEMDRGIILDLSQVKLMDPSGAKLCVELMNDLLNLKIKWVVRGLAPACRQAIFVAIQSGIKSDGAVEQVELRKGVAAHIASNETEVFEILGRSGLPVGFDRLVVGVEKFRRELRLGYGSLFKTLAEGQKPHTLFITCSDSRIDPNLITSTDPGELFIVRNVGNIVPPFGMGQIPAEGAAIEFAIGILGIQEIVVCGHSGCGAMKALTSDDFFSQKNIDQFPNMVSWLRVAEGLKQQLPQGASLGQASELNALLQLENLKTYPLIQAKLERKELRLAAWYYNIGEAELEAWDEGRKIFVRIGTEETRSLEKRMEAGIQFQFPGW